MAPVFPFRYTTYGAGFSTAHDPSFPISDRTDGLLAFLTPFQRLKTELNRKNAAQIDGRPFLVQWFLPIPRWGKTLKKTVEDDMRSLVHPAPLLNLSLYSVSRRTIDHPQSDIVIVAQAVTEEARPNHSQLRSRVYPKILSLLSRSVLESRHLLLSPSGWISYQPLPQLLKKQTLTPLLLVPRSADLKSDVTWNTPSTLVGCSTRWGFCPRRNPKKI